MKTLFVIPARGGSKGVPGKNIKLLNGKTLISYSLEYARLFAGDDDICVSTDSKDIADVVSSMNYKVPFLRPAHLASDTAGSYEVMLHALEAYEKKNGSYDLMVLLQPTSPFRKKEHLTQAMELMNPGIDMVVSVKESEANPYYNLFEKNSKGFLEQSKEGRFERRQDCPPVYQYNGSLYVISTSSLKKTPLNQFNHIVPYIMPAEYSIDLDTPLDWIIAENVGNKIL
jgi:CMP-N,N'-diacetyllegionaminic acid synthase